MTAIPDVPPPPHARNVGDWGTDGLRLYSGPYLGPKGVPAVISVWGVQRRDGSIERGLIVVDGLDEPLTPREAVAAAIAVREADPAELEALEGAPPMPTDAFADCLIFAAQVACPLCDGDGRVQSGEESALCFHGFPH